jgi:hypothetical protein
VYKDKGTLKLNITCKLQEKLVIQQIKRKLIGYTLRKDSHAIEKVLKWNPQERKEFGALAQNRIQWRCFMEILCS